MDYEVDFIGVKKEECASDALAVCIRWKDYYGDFHVGIYDAGFKAHGIKMKEFLNEYYFNDVYEDKVIDFVCISHSDQDHTSGIKTILESFKVKKLYMNRPWLYIDELKKYFSDGRMTEASLERELKQEYKSIDEIESIAERRNIPIYEVFEGTTVGGVFTVLSPSYDYYINLIIASRKTRLEHKDESDESIISSVFSEGSKYELSVPESWYTDTIREDQVTSEENEMSVILLGENMLFTGDAGIEALNAAAYYYRETYGKSLADTVDFIQIPHHGGRRNVSPSILDEIVGSRVGKDSIPTKTAFVGAAEKSDHPLKMVVNAFIRRGCMVYKTEEHIIHHSHGSMPERKGWSRMEEEPFSRKVEDWD